MIQMPFSEFTSITLLLSAAAIVVVWIGQRALWRRQQRRNIIRRLKEHSG